MSTFITGIIDISKFLFFAVISSTFLAIIHFCLELIPKNNIIGKFLSLGNGRATIYMTICISIILIFNVILLLDKLFPSLFK